ncbi:hypothetical protein [Natrinema halophilum]|uniref:Asparagine synthetase domain-containing protein n=1 Tax=Natrinema halophilum TaxID=1699371 RepID=A0A7D5KMI5_9EURY|nr:hypothetical protein [Natrinema halophilum]QLG50758.1 hypothetical protein HYG82_18905 [Natrinema halophilum]
MNRELFGVFGGIETFERFRSSAEFDEVLRGSTITVGVRDRDLGTPGWSATYDCDDGYCFVWGEAYVPGGERNAARWLFERFETVGLDALEMLNGSYLVVIDSDNGDSFVATDPVRSRECFYTDEPGVRVFGTDSATVGRTISDPMLHRDSLLEYLHLGVTLGKKTAITDLHRLPLDSRLTPNSVDSFDRFVYRPGEFDYVAELADRLDRALQRRSSLPGQKGLLLSAGYDSRIILSQIPDIDHTYTVGTPNAAEVRTAKRLASQYDSIHTTFPPDERYIRPDETKTRYTHGIKESLHIHHGGYTDEMGVDTMYHGLLFDTFIRGHFTADNTVDVLGKPVPTGRLDPDPDPVEVLLDKFGYTREASLQLSEQTIFDVDPEAFVRQAIADELDSVEWRTNTVQNKLACCGIANQPSLTFHSHLSDHFLTPFLATDRDLLDWHLRTPPEHRTTETFLEACKRIDGDILRHRPPDRPYEATVLNEVEGFVRRKTPFLPSFDPPWPNRESLFEQYDLDQHLLAGFDHVHPLPARHKLRVNDLREWLEWWPKSRTEPLPWLRHPESSTV